jgi:hypothetical protein
MGERGLQGSAMLVLIYGRGLASLVDLSTAERRCHQHGVPRRWSAGFG